MAARARSWSRRRCWQDSITSPSLLWWSLWGLPYRTELLTGSMTGKQKRLACERIENQEVDIIVGTHALIQEKVHYKKAGCGHYR